MQAYLVLHMGSFRLRGFQELAACRGIVKQVGDLNGGAGGDAGTSRLVLQPAVDAYFPALQRLLLPGAELEAGDAGNAGNGLSAEA